MPTFPTPMTEILVWRFVGDGGAVLEIDLKKVWLRSRPPGPNDEDEVLFCMVNFLCVKKRLFSM